MLFRSSGTALTNLNYNSILNPPTIPNLNNPCTFISTLFVSGTSIFQNASTCNSTLNISNVLTLGSNSGLYLNNASNSLLAVSQAVNQFSNSAITGDTVLRANSTNSLIFQTGAGTSAISINPSNNIIMFNAATHSSTLFVSGTSIFQNAVSCNFTLYVTNSYGISHGGPNIPQSTTDSNLFGNTCYYSAFAGDSHLYSYWGLATI